MTYIVLSIAIVKKKNTDCVECCGYSAFRVSTILAVTGMKSLPFLDPMKYGMCSHEEE
jgi:hypothetical protein